MNKVALDKAVPEFKTQATSNKDIHLSAMIGYNIVLYFYPKDNTLGCTREGEEFQQLYNEFKETKTCILGVSRDSLESHEDFKTEKGFSFELISDSDESLCDLFDVIKLKNMYGREVLGIERSTFLINSEGILKQEWRKVKVEGHAEEVLNTVKNL
ncbi:MAG: peroxiredoxin [Pseudomonadales bacterium]|nr:peroxiredoxin [Pseudomonadales bacterium]